MDNLSVGDIIQDFDPRRSGHELLFKIERFVGDDDSMETNEAFRNEKLLSGPYQKGDIIAVGYKHPGKAALKRAYCRLY
jgi:hypothetical protein